VSRGAGPLGRLAGRLRTVRELFVYFAKRERFFFLPLLVVLLLAALLLALTGGLGYVAPFVYAIF
jgi:Family of unknown function (DUF5989)